MKIRKLWLYLTELQGWRLRAMLFLAGASATLAFAPFFILPVLFISFPLLIAIATAASNLKKSWGCGWWWGYGYFVASLYWIAYALLQEAEKFAWMIPFAVLGIPAVIACYTGLCCVIVSLTKRWFKDPIILFVLVYMVMEYVRTYALSGFPWNLPGYALGINTLLMQGAAWVGVHGLGLLVLCVASIPCYFLMEGRKSKLMIPSLAAVVLIAFSAAGAWRLLHANNDTVPGVNLRLVQGNIAQNHKWDPLLRIGIVEKHISMSLSPGIETVTHLIWSETAVPYVLNIYSPIHQIIDQGLPDNVTLMTGGIHFEPHWKEDKVWNAMFILNGRAEELAHYDKTHLVPFGEYVPFRNLLPFVEKITEGNGDFLSGTGPKTLSVKGAPPFSPLVCYEVIFPEKVIEPGTRPQWMVNITNDAWFGVSTGPYQHFAMARFRAVEQGLGLVRVANTGISAVVDPYGRIKAHLGLGEEGIIDSLLPKALPPTFYARFGDSIFWGMMALMAATVCLTLRRDQKS